MERKRDTTAQCHGDKCYPRHDITSKFWLVNSFILHLLRNYYMLDSWRRNCKLVCDCVTETSGAVETYSRGT